MSVSSSNTRQRILLGITGASGMLYLPPLLEHLGRAGIEVHGIASASGSKVLKMELGLTTDDLAGVGHWYRCDDFTARPASGSSRFDAMVILPCTMGTLAAVAAGISGNLIHRAADVTLKERRTLVLGVRETPLNRTHLRNMLAILDCGGCIMPLMPGFYHRPLSLQEMAHDFAARVCDQLKVEVPAARRWQEQE